MAEHAQRVVYSVRTTFVCCKTPHTFWLVQYLNIVHANSISQLNSYVYPNLINLASSVYTLRKSYKLRISEEFAPTCSIIYMA